jgi:hypothetical protein
VTGTLLFADEQHVSGAHSLPIPKGVEVSAVFGGPGDCYRYSLEWSWAPRKTLLGLLMNPATASKHVADRTLLWLYRWSERNGFGRLIVCNADAYRCQDQARLAEIDDPCGPSNLGHIIEAAGRADAIAIGYGQPKVRAVHDHGPRMVRALRAAGHELHVWGLAKNGTPKHPLYLPSDTPLTIWKDPHHD